MLSSSIVMSPNADASPFVPDVLSSLRGVCDRHGLASLASDLSGMSELLRSDMRDVEIALDLLPFDTDDVRKSAGHLVARGGKRLRPMCVSLAARLGTGFDSKIRDLAVAVELVHCATLLHDDVVDVGDRRRGAPTARVLYGNAASIFAGDWLLVEALRLVRRSASGDVLERLLDRIDAMITAEAMQLAKRGRFEASEAHYFSIVDGKTAALFRWAMYAGGRGAGIESAGCEALERFGRELGVAFQLVDDALDYEGTSAVIGKEPFADLREGKMTYPLLVAARGDADVRALLERAAQDESSIDAQEAVEIVARGIAATDAAAATRRLANEHVDRAIAELASFDDGAAKRALTVVARATVLRDA